MRVHEIADSLSGQEISPKSTFSKQTLDELLSSCSPENNGFCGNRLYSLGHILLTGNMSADRLVEVLHSKKDNHVKLTFFTTKRRGSPAFRRWEESARLDVSFIGNFSSLNFYFSLNLHHILYYNLEKEGGEKEYGSNFEIEIVDRPKGK